MRNWLLLTMTILFTATAAVAQVHRRLVNFEWDAIEGAVGYEIEIRQAKKPDSKPYNFKVDNASWNGRLPPGSYALRLRAFDYRKVPGSWGEDINFEVNLENVVMTYPAPNANVTTKEDTKEDIKLQWNAVGGADSYVLEIQSEDGKFQKTAEIEGTTYSLSLPVATQYTWKVAAKNKAGMASDAVSVSQFNFLAAKLDKPKIDKPDSDFVREVKWSRPDHTQKFDLAIARFNPETKKWQVLSKLTDHGDETVPFNQKWPGGDYKISVRGKGTLRQSSDVASETFKVRDGNRSPAAEYTANVRKSIDRVSGWYGIASYLITQIKYSSLYQETQTALSYDAIGGTGRLGLGWFHPRTPWGFIGIIDLSGFSNEGKTLTYASAEFSGVYRKTVGERGELRTQMGLYYKELPGTIGDASAKTTSNQQLSTAGPHLGLEYWYSMTPKLGLQANTHFYMSMIKMSTPNGQDIVPSLSTQFGFLGSWRLSPRFTGLMGYARREDKIKYKAGSPEGLFTGTSGSDSNETTVQGDYLNFFAEYAF